MIVRWEQGRAVIDVLLKQGRLTRVAPNRALADSMLIQARAHLAASVIVIGLDPQGAFSLTYDAARKALAAILVISASCHLYGTSARCDLSCACDGPLPRASSDLQRRPLPRSTVRDGECGAGLRPMGLSHPWRRVAPVSSGNEQHRAARPGPRISGI